MFNFLKTIFKDRSPQKQSLDNEPEEEAPRDFSSYHVTQDPQKKDPLGNPFLINYKEYFTSAESERRCCFCGNKIPVGPVRQIPHKEYTSIYGGQLPYWRYCNSCRRIAETRIEDLKQFPSCHPEAFAFLHCEIDNEKRRIEAEKKRKAEREAAEARKAAEIAERKQFLIQGMEPFLRKHGGSPGIAERILDYIKNTWKISYEHSATKVEATEDFISIYRSVHINKFFNNGEEFRYVEWKICWVDESTLSEEDRSRIIETEADKFDEPWGEKPFYKNPFGLSGIFETCHFARHRSYHVIADPKPPIP